MVSTTPTFNLKVVLNETGIAADTLRAWERRYGLPMPQRTAGGHRLYSQRDIETIKWLIKRQAEGLSISRAVDLWNEQIGSGADPLADSVPEASASSPGVAPYPLSDTTLDSLRTRWVDACLSFSEAKAEQALNQAFSIFPVEAVCMEVLQKGMSEIGDLWYENRTTVQQEHFASGLAMRRLDALLLASPAPTRNQTVMVGCPPDEWHTLTPLMLALFLRRRGLNVLYLGANVPAARFTDTIAQTRADAVVLVAQHLLSAASLQHVAYVLSAERIPVGFGGRIFNLRPTIAETIPGCFLGHDIPSALEEVETLLKRNLPQPMPKVLTHAYAASHLAFTGKRPQIELTVRESVEPLGISPEDIETAIHFLGENIVAALQLGDISHVSAEIDWLQELLQAHGASAQHLVYFMETYARAIDKHINGQGKPIFEWINAETQRLQS